VVAAGGSSPLEFRGSDLPLLSSGPGLAGRPLIHSELGPGGGAGLSQPQEWRLPYGEYGKPGCFSNWGPIKFTDKSRCFPTTLKSVSVASRVLLKCYPQNILHPLRCFASGAWRKWAEMRGEAV
jgi:hypothetical protein